MRQRILLLLMAYGATIIGFILVSIPQIVPMTSSLYTTITGPGGIVAVIPIIMWVLLFIYLENPAAPIVALAIILVARHIYVLLVTRYVESADAEILHPVATNA